MSAQAAARDLVGELARIRVLPVVVIDDASRCGDLADALLEGGIPALEITFRTGAAESALRSVSGRDDLIVGAGTVLDVAAVDRAADAGASFIVSPGFDADVVARTLELGLVPLPGVATATELQAARRAGSTDVKFFPAVSSGGVDAIRALAAPFPGVRFVPSGGITVDTMGDYLAEASVAAVGGSWVASRSRVARGAWQEVRDSASETVRRLEAVRAR